MNPFWATMWRSQGKGGWTFVDVPDALVPDAAGPWGRIPMRATVDGRTWDTSLGRNKDRTVLLAIPKRIRGAKGTGDVVQVELSFR